MSNLRDHYGSKCPACAKDILQPEPSTNRMPGREMAWCPSCHASLSIEQLEGRRGKKPGGLLGKLFQKPNRS